MASTAHGPTSLFRATADIVIGLWCGAATLAARYRQQRGEPAVRGVVAVRLSALFKDGEPLVAGPTDRRRGVGWLDNHQVPTAGYAGHLKSVRFLVTATQDRADRVQTGGT